MKKVLSMGLAVVLVLSFAGCGVNQNVTIQSSSTSLSSTTQSKSTTTTQSLSQSTAQTTTQHIHSYTASVTTQAGCTTDGVKTYTCTCGDSYLEKIAAKGHKWSQWVSVLASHPFHPSVMKRTCSGCKATEQSSNYNSMLKNYLTLVGWLDCSYTSPAQLTAAQAATSVTLMMGIEPQVNWDTGEATRTYPIAKLNEYTTKCFGRTFDFTSLREVSMPIGGTISYDAAQNALVWKFIYGSGEERSAVVSDGFINVDDTRFVMNYHWEFLDGTKSEACSFVVELKNGNYVITSIHHS